MWYTLGQWIIKRRVFLLLALLGSTCFMGYHASKVSLSYEFTRAIPTDNPKYQDYQAFLKRFGTDGNTMVVGFETDHFYEKSYFNAVADLQKKIKSLRGVTAILNIPDVVNLINDTANAQFKSVKIFTPPYTDQAALDSAAFIFKSLPFYKTLLYSPSSNAYLMGVSLDGAIINSKNRSVLIYDINTAIQAFEKETNSSVHLSGLPYIRTIVADRIKKEMNIFLIASFVLSALTLLLFFRSMSAMLMSMVVVAIGVVWSLGTVVLFGYKITLLTALIPPLVVVIGIPNCIYFFNKYHTAFLELKDKDKAIVTMVGRMGIVTLFCNIAAAIGFAVFALTKSALLKEFGLVAGINIMVLFFISLVFIPAALSYLPSPKAKHTRYLENKILEKLLIKIERWTFHHARWVYGVTIVITAFALVGMSKLKSEGFIVDDLPKQDKIYTDLKWFEKNFGGVMPLEIMVDTKKKNGLLRTTQPISKIEELSVYIAQHPETARPLSFVEGLKFAKQAYYDGDTLSYDIPYEGDLAFMGPYFKSPAPQDSGAQIKKEGVAKLLNSFMDSAKQVARISVNMKDIGSAKLPILVKDFEAKANEIFDTAHYKVTFTGSTITFLEGSSFIIKGLQESIVWAFLLIALCMLYLFRSLRILICSLIPNVIPLVITAGIMGWAGIALKPSTVLIFSIALGIAIDVTIRFLINYKQELPHYNNQVSPTLIQTIKHTGISIIYTSLVLIAGFIIFCISDFGGTKALGWLTSLTLVVGTLTNLILLPVLILHFQKRKK
jgi:predicted RND superfamily exporter protein